MLASSAEAEPVKVAVRLMSVEADTNKADKTRDERKSRRLFLISVSYPRLTEEEDASANVI